MGFQQGSIYSEKYFEVAVMRDQSVPIRLSSRQYWKNDILEDPENQIVYSVGELSSEYTIFLLVQLFTNYENKTV